MNTNTLNVRTSNNVNTSAVFALLGDFLKTEVSKGWTWGDAIEEVNARGVEVDLDETPLVRFLNSQAGGGWTWGAAIDEALMSGGDVSFPTAAYEAFLANEASEVQHDEGMDGAELKFWLREMRLDAILNKGNRRGGRSATRH